MQNSNLTLLSEDKKIEIHTNSKYQDSCFNDNFFFIVTEKSIIKIDTKTMEYTEYERNYISQSDNSKACMSLNSDTIVTAQTMVTTSYVIAENTLNGQYDKKVFTGMVLSIVPTNSNSFDVYIANTNNGTFSTIDVISCTVQNDSAVIDAESRGNITLNTKDETAYHSEFTKTKLDDSGFTLISPILDQFSVIMMHINSDNLSVDAMQTVNVGAGALSKTELIE